MNLSRVPPARKITWTISERYSFKSATTSGLSIVSLSAVKPRMSEKRMVTSRCSPSSVPSPCSRMRRATAGEK